MTEDDSPARRFRADTEGTEVELPYAGIKTFLGGDYRDVDAVDDCDAAVLGVPFDGAVSNRPGARYGPGAIRRASAWWAYLSGYKGRLTNMNTGRQVDFADVTLGDCGDVPVFPLDLEKTARSITAHVASLAQQTVPVILGGDHYCTYPAVRGVAEGVEAKSVGLVQIDAHSDTVSETPIFGTDFHGSSTNLIHDLPYVDYSSVSQVALRGYEGPDFFDFAEDTGLSVYTMRDIERDGIRAVVEAALLDAASDTDAVYVTFDIDAVDPAVAPGTGTPEPGGLDATEALAVMEVLGGNDSVRAVDLMEVSPPFDWANATSRLGAFLLVTLLDRRFAQREPPA